MNQDDRYHTTSWDGDEMARRAEETGYAAAGEHSAARPAGQKRKKKRKKKRTNPLLAILLWVAIVGASSAIFAAVGWMLANDFAALNKPMKEVSFQVTEDFIAEVREEKQEDGSTKEVTYYDMAKVAQALKEEGLIEYDWFFRIFCKFYHADTKLTTGTFSLNTEMDYMALVRSMRTAGGKTETVNVTIPEGYTVAQIIDLLAENGVGTVEALTDTAANYEFDSYVFVNNEDLGDPRRLEGYLFPDTYEFYVGARTELAFNSILSNFQNKVYANEDLADLFAESAYSTEEIITMASLIERETDGTDRRNISSVIHNRLEKGGETGRLLQIDASLVYAAGRAITQDDYTSLDSPYNLYLHEGLPPTPIANPGLAAIQAALDPADTSYYFYVLVGDKHVFSETLAEHNRNVAAAAEAAAQAGE
ncbi:MAG: endolytic transglycosylase MltG [Oscillospiraceae bacterium]|nr:endolytic transglycosylase MltG [Oscillospiraceae bacterium]